jgi:ferric enterobactin receptor
VKKGIVFLFIIANFYTLQAQRKQEPGVHAGLTGKVIDSLSGEPLNYATVTLFLTADKKPVNGSITDVKGMFSVNNISDGIYKVVIEYSGYKPFTFSNILVNRQNMPLDLKTITLVKKAVMLQTVTISAKPKIVENKIDKIVFNAEQDITSQSGVATDILKKVPQVSVDIDGNVELAGSTSVRFLINGKPSSAFGNNITDVLQSIPASQIKSIEVVTNPGAKYDAQGLGGIINIILKKNTARGINGNLSLTAGTRHENGSFNFNARNKGFGINAFFSGNTKLNSITPSVYDRVANSSLDSTTELLHQEGSSGLTRHGVETGLGFDWTYHTKNNFSGSVNYNNFGRSGSGYSNQSQQIFDAAGSLLSDIETLNKSASSFLFQNIDINLDYRRTFNKEGRELEISATNSFGNNSGLSNNNQYLLPEDSLIYGINNVNPGKEKENEISIDYAEPISEKVILGIGGKLNLYDINSSSAVTSFEPNNKAFLYDSTLSNSFRYRQKIYAAYTELSFPVGHLFDAKIGGRYERTDIDSYYSQAQQQINSPGYNTFVPSVFFLRKL